MVNGSFLLRNYWEKVAGKHSQQDLIAALKTSSRSPNHLNLFKFSDWHGFRSDYSRTAHGLGEPESGLKDRHAAWESSLRIV
jgi:hypothetical protein